MHSTFTANYRNQALHNELGLRQSPQKGLNTFHALGSGKDILIIGLGPDPAIADEFIQSLNNLHPSASIAYIESPDFATQMDGNWKQLIPAAWSELDLETALRSIKKAGQNKADTEDITFVLYLPGLRLFPSFFGPLFGAVWAAFSAGPQAAPGIGEGITDNLRPILRKLSEPLPGRGQIRSLTLPGSERGLLHRELALAFAKQGIKVHSWNPEEGRDLLLSTEAAAPGTLAPPEGSLGDLFFSVNFRGLDAYGAVYHYLRAKGVRVAVWCVDNPWHLLSGLRAPYWRELYLFVTDKSFISDLKTHGAKHVYHLPLAACQDMFSPPDKDSPAVQNAAYLRDLAPLVFVGRTAFPDRDKFFAAQHPPQNLLAHALKSLVNGARPDFFYWFRVLELTSLWPGYKSRLVGFASEECSRRRRKLCISAAVPQAENSHAPGVTIFGDAAWAKELSDLAGATPDLRGTVDYYTELPALYNTAEMILNVASLLLPAGLNQRHFDVWAAGGAQICDASPGLDIFPEELTRPIIFHKPGDIPALAHNLSSNPALLRSLKHDWAALLNAKHTYDCRVIDVLNALEA